MQNYWRIGILSFIITLFFYSCKSDIDLQVEKSLNLAGENRTELEKVLLHYKYREDDELKLEAAKFLIANMSAYYFYNSDELSKYHQQLDSIFQITPTTQPKSSLQDSLLDILILSEISKSKPLSDLHYIKANTLIDNIDKAFEAWKSPFAKNLSFKDFCEYILPYKTFTEIPSYWREIYRDVIYSNSHIYDLLDTKTNLENGLIHYFPFDNDISDAKNPHIITTAWNEISFVKGKTGNAMKLDTSNYITIHDSIMSGLESFSISTWFYQEESRLYARIFSFANDGTFYFAFVPSAEYEESRIQLLNGSSKQSVGIKKLPEKEWIHMTITYSNNYISLYINGEIVLNRKFEIPINEAQSPYNYIGKSQHPKDPFFCGMIDDFRIYNRSLNFSEVLELAGKSKYSAPTTEHLQFVLNNIKSLYFIHLPKYSFFRGSYEPSRLMNMKSGLCFDYSILGLYIYRSLGIPASFDFTPQWANRSLGHEWNAVYTIEEGMKDYSFNAFPAEKIGTHLERRREKKSKVFRKTFAQQKGSPSLINSPKDVPRLFQSPCIKDVTDEYIDCADISINVKMIPKGKKYAYLCTFDNKEWKPVHYGTVKGKMAHFGKMGLDVLYLPVFFENGAMYVIGNPFILTKDRKIKRIKLDKTNLQTVRLTRKYTEENIIRHGETIKDGYFQVANQQDFEDAITIHTINEVPEINYNTVSLNLDHSYRFFRFVAKGGSHGGEIAEIEIYEKNSGKKLTGTPIGNNRCSPDNGIETVFDGNPLTYYRTYNGYGGEVGLDFGDGVDIGYFRFLPRNDDNFIREGEIYEFFYWDNKWVSLGKQTGTSTQYLEYDNAPINALFRLINHTKGKEERIFTYENGKQIWW